MSEQIYLTYAWPQKQLEGLDAQRRDKVLIDCYLRGSDTAEGDEGLPAHRCVLVPASHYFKARFTSDFQGRCIYVTEGVSIV